MNFTDLLVEALGGTPHRDTPKPCRLADDLRMVVDDGQPLLRANGIDVVPPCSSPSSGQPRIVRIIGASGSTADDRAFAMATSPRAQ